MLRPRVLLREIPTSVTIAQLWTYMYGTSQDSPKLYEKVFDSTVAATEASCRPGYVTWLDSLLLLQGSGCLLLAVQTMSENCHAMMTFEYMRSEISCVSNREAWRQHRSCVSPNLQPWSKTVYQDAQRGLNTETGFTWCALDKCKQNV